MTPAQTTRSAQDLTNQFLAVAVELAHSIDKVRNRLTDPDIPSAAADELRDALTLLLGAKEELIASADRLPQERGHASGTQFSSARSSPAG